MGNGMNRILDGVFVGSIRDSRDKEQITKFNITHILTIHEDPREGGLEGIKYLCFTASDNASQEIKSFFPQAIEFIHEARLKGGNVLVHCLAGISRSTSLVIAYIMTVCELPWYEALNAVRGARKGTNPNFGFQRQLQSYEYTSIKQVRESLFKKYGVYDKEKDLLTCKALLEIYQQNQQAANEQAKNNNNTTNIPVNKTYPLAYNAYNLDSKDSNSDNQTSSLITTTTNNTDRDNNNKKEEDKNLVNIVNEQEKADIIQKIFE